MAEMARPIQTTGWTAAGGSGKSRSSPTARRRARTSRARPSDHVKNTLVEMIVHRAGFRLWQRRLLLIHAATDDVYAVIFAVVNRRGVVAQDSDGQLLFVFQRLFLAQVGYAIFDVALDGVV